MSRDGKYILSYESQMYVAPTPMELDKRAVQAQSPAVRFTHLDDFTIFFEMPKYTLLKDTIDKLKADTVFEAIDGDPFQRIR